MTIFSSMKIIDMETLATPQFLGPKTSSTTDDSTTEPTEPWDHLLTPRSAWAPVVVAAA